MKFVFPTAILAGAFGAWFGLTTLAYNAIGQTTPITQQPQTWGFSQTYLGHNFAMTTGAAIVASTTHSIAGGQAAPLGDISVVNAANANDAVGLPKCVAGSLIVVISVGSTATFNIYPQNATDTIDGGTAGASVTLTSAHRGSSFYCGVTGNWTSDLFGAVSS